MRFFFAVLFVEACKWMVRENIKCYVQSILICTRKSFNYPWSICSLRVYSECIQKTNSELFCSQSSNRPWSKVRRAQLLVRSAISWIRPQTVSNKTINIQSRPRQNKLFIFVKRLHCNCCCLMRKMPEGTNLKHYQTHEIHLWVKSETKTTFGSFRAPRLRLHHNISLRFSRTCNWANRRSPVGTVQHSGTSGWALAFPMLQLCRCRYGSLMVAKFIVCTA